MSRIMRLLGIVATLLVSGTLAFAAHFHSGSHHGGGGVIPYAGGGGHHHGGGGGGHGPFPYLPFGVSSGWSIYPYPYYTTVGMGGLPVSYMSPSPMFLPGFMSPGLGSMGGFTPTWNGAGIAGPLPPGGLRRPGQGVPVPLRRPADVARSQQFCTYGDRLFRAKNYRRAYDRYEQAARSDPHSAGPRIRLAQIAIVRNQYAEAANHLREAQAAEPNWLTKPFDVQSIYSEPGDFAKQIAKLEAHLQAEPQDRDGWLVLGAQWYLSGRTEKASDVFLRLTDRKPDATLAAFLDAARPVDRDGQ